MGNLLCIEMLIFSANDILVSPREGETSEWDNPVWDMMHANATLSYYYLQEVPYQVIQFDFGMFIYSFVYIIKYLFLIL